MTTRKVPRVATWILRHFGCSPNNEAILGDLVERHQKGRTGTWFWRQVVMALFTGCAQETKEHKFPVVRAIAVGWLLHFVALLLLKAPTLERTLAWFNFNAAGYLVFFTFIAILIFGTTVIGWIVSRTSGEHRKAAVVGYAVSSLLYGVITFFFDRYLFWSRSGIPLVSYVTSFVLPLSLVLIVFSTIGTILVLFGGGLLPISSRRNS